MGDIWFPHNHFLPCFKGIKGWRQNKKKKVEQKAVEGGTRMFGERKKKGDMIGAGRNFWLLSWGEIHGFL